MTGINLFITACYFQMVMSHIAFLCITLCCAHFRG